MGDNSGKLELIPHTSISIMVLVEKAFGRSEMSLRPISLLVG